MPFVLCCTVVLLLLCMLGAVFGALSYDCTGAVMSNAKGELKHWNRQRELYISVDVPQNGRQARLQAFCCKIAQ